MYAGTDMVGTALARMTTYARLSRPLQMYFTEVCTTLAHLIKTHACSLHVHTE